MKNSREHVDTVLQRMEDNVVLTGRGHPSVADQITSIVEKLRILNVDSNAIERMEQMARDDIALDKEAERFTRFEKTAGRN